jgi:threonine dehydratase
MRDASSPLSLSHIRDARAVLAGRLAPSPCLPVDDGQARLGRLFVKAENLMPTGSFKIRGATYRISLLTAAERRRGVIAYSTGNHAQAVAKAARDAGVAATIVMSPDVPALKVTSTEKWGAKVVMAEPSSHARRALAERLAGESGLVLVPPYDDYAIMAGQGTIGLELLDQMPADVPMTVFVPIGGGGLVAEVAVALKQAPGMSGSSGSSPSWRTMPGDRSRPAASSGSRDRARAWPTPSRCSSSAIWFFLWFKPSSTTSKP